MFNKLKQFKNLRDKAKQMQNALSQESVTVEKSGIKLVMNGNLEVISLEINEDLEKTKLESKLKDVINEAVKKVQRIMAKKMQSMGGLNI